MASVTKRIKDISQPRGGYLKPKDFKEVQLEGAELHDASENVHASLIGLAVDYLTRFKLGASPEEAFRISLRGAMCINDTENAQKLLSNIKDLDDESIASACKLAGYDVCLRVGVAGYKDVSLINPDCHTTDNIRIMVNRSLNFFKIYGPATLDGFTFEGGYTELITSGDGDFLTMDTLWDFKVSNKKPLNTATLQLLTYYLMGKQSIHKEFDNVSKLGIFNPRLNVVYTTDVNTIPQDTIHAVATDVIGYPEHYYPLYKQRDEVDLNESNDGFDKGNALNTNRPAMRFSYFDRDAIWFKNEGEALRMLKEYQILSPSKTFKDLDSVVYKSIDSYENVITHACEVIGYNEKNTNTDCIDRIYRNFVIEVNEEIFAINTSYLKDMQKKNWNKASSILETE